MLLKTKSETRLAQGGDRNTKFFRTKATARRVKNEIRELIDDSCMLRERKSEA
jgi:hypothetical protein